MEDPSPASSDASFTALTADIVSSFVVNNKIEVSDLRSLILSVHQTLSSLDQPAVAPAEELPKPTPAQIRKSITADALISFEDGQPYKTLKRHLTKKGLTVADYKIKWGLPADYPSTAPSYSAQRSEMAKARGLGNKARNSGAMLAKTPKAPKAKKAAAE